MKPSTALLAILLVAPAGMARATDRVAASSSFMLGDYANAAALFRKAAAAGDSFAMDRLGEMYRDGQGLKKDLRQSVRWFEKAASADSPEGQVDLGRAYEEGQGVAARRDTARLWYRKAADQGSQDAVTRLCALDPANPTTEDRMEQYQWCDLARDVAALNTTEGFDPFTDDAADTAKKALSPKDLAEAVAREIAWKQEPHFGHDAAIDRILKGAATGDPAAQTALAKLYFSAYYAPYDVAAALFRKAADHGNAEALYYLGVCARDEHGTAGNASLAYFQAAADKGNGDALEALADVAAKAENPDRKRIVELERAAAEAGNAQAQAEIGNYYASGDDGAKQPAEAVKWYRRAAEQGNWLGVKSLASAYRDGAGLPTDKIAAYKWFDVLVFFTDPHDPDPQGDRDAVASDLSPAQLAAARKQSKDWLAAYLDAKRERHGL